MLDRCWDIIRRNVIPTSVSQQSESLRDLLTHFCTSDIAFKSATVKNGTLNYIEVVRSTRPDKDLRKHITPTDISTAKSLRPKKTLILMHGFGSGLGFFFKNYDDLAESFDRVIAVDWLGMGGSSRQSKFKMSTETLLNYSQESPRLSVAEQIYARAMIEPLEPLPSTALAIDFFVDSLDELREQLVYDGTLAADESLHLAGHSLGGYLAAQYALRYPGKVDSLILISPVGIPQQPALSTRTKGSQMSWGLYTASSAWAMNITPQSVVRMAGNFKSIHDI
jgi:pimeloyl-ACP methyl ester carboxylesterase